MHDKLADGGRLALQSSIKSSGMCTDSSNTIKTQAEPAKCVSTATEGYLSVPGVVQNDGRVGMVAKEDGHQGGDELMAQRVPGRGDLQQRQDQHVWTVFDGESKELLHLLVLAHLGEPEQTLHQIQTLPVKGNPKARHATAPIHPYSSGDGGTLRSPETVVGRMKLFLTPVTLEPPSHAGG